MEKTGCQIIFDAVVKGCFYIIQNTHLCEQTDILEGTCHTFLTDFCRFLSHQAFPIQHDRTVCRTVYTGQHIKSRCFSGSVWPDEPYQSTFVDRHIQSVYCPEPSKGDTQVFHFQ